MTAKPARNLGEVVPPEGVANVEGCWAIGWLDEQDKVLDLMLTVHHTDATNAMRVAASILQQMKRTNRIIGIARISSPCDHVIETDKDVITLSHRPPKPPPASPPSNRLH